jgi:hypothetical protein
MDLIKIIEEKSELFKDTKYFQGINFVIHHIKIAEKHLSNAQAGDEYLYTDVRNKKSKNESSKSNLHANTNKDENDIVKTIAFN